MKNALLVVCGITEVILKCQKISNKLKGFTFFKNKNLTMQKDSLFFKKKVMTQKKIEHKTIREQSNKAKGFTFFKTKI